MEPMQLEMFVAVVEEGEVVLQNQKAIVLAAGSSLAKVVTATIYLEGMNDFAKVNEIYGRYFSSARPARSTVELAG
jgi:2-iminobutanoate/2-iminopropanoate deaminase